MSARFTTQYGFPSPPLGPPFNPVRCVLENAKLRIINPPTVAGVWYEAPAKYFERNHYLPASMAEFWGAYLRDMITGDLTTPIVCLGSVWIHPITAVRRVPYLTNLRDPIDFDYWRLRLADRPFNTYWRFAVWEAHNESAHTT